MEVPRPRWSKAGTRRQQGLQEERWTPGDELRKWVEPRSRRPPHLPISTELLVMVPSQLCSKTPGPSRPPSTFGPGSGPVAATLVLLFLASSVLVWSSYLSLLHQVSLLLVFLPLVLVLLMRCSWFWPSYRSLLHKVFKFFLWLDLVPLLRCSWFCSYCLLLLFVCPVPLRSFCFCCS